MNEFRSGHRKLIKIPTADDFRSFHKDYRKHLGRVSRRSEKAYRKSFLKFSELEDELLYSLCDQDEFTANMLMRTGMSGFSKLEADRMKLDAEAQLPECNSMRRITATVKASESILPEAESAETLQAEEEHKEKMLRSGTAMYEQYMQKRLRIYRVTFAEGSRKQQKLLRKMEGKAKLWRAYKNEDDKMHRAFEQKYPGISKAAKGSPDYADHMASKLPDFSGTQMERGFVPKVGVGDARNQLEKTADGLNLGDNQSIKDVVNVTDMFKSLRAEKAKNDTTGAEDEKRKESKVNGEKAKPLKDRIYGGFDFRWLNSSPYYPEGFGLVFIGGIKLNNNSGINVEFNSALNASGLGISKDDMRFEEAGLVSNYSLGANIDYRLYRWVFVGIGLEGIRNNLEVPAGIYVNELKRTDFNVGVPLIIKCLLPVRGGNSTTLELRYDLNGKNNIKPTFDFRVGYLIGRR